MSATSAAPGEPLDDYGFDAERRSEWGRVRSRFLQHRLATASLVILVALSTMGLLAAQLAPYNYLELNVKALSASPSWAHLFGTDQIGRDYFSRVLYGIGTEVKMVLIVAFVGTLIGTLVGAVCGYFGGVVDNVLMRLTDLMLTLPPLITLLVASAYLHANTLFKISALLACLLWMPLARIARGASLSLREREYVEAARAMGASNTRIIARHIVPNALGSVSVAATVMAAAAVILETTLSYLGVGITGNPTGRTETTLPSLGDVMAAATNEGLFNWWGIVFPGLAIIFIVMPIYFVGDGIRDALDPTQRRSVSARTLRRRRRPPSRAARLLARIPRPALPELGLSWQVPKLRLPFVERALRLVERRRRHRRRLVLEAAVVLGLTAATAGAVYVFGVGTVASSWRVAGTAVQDVSRARGAQTEISVAAYPANPRVLFAASNDSLERSIRVYGSTDGGLTWSAKLGPRLGLDDCARGEPAATVGPDGRQYVAFIANPFCTAESPYPYLVVASRAGSSAKWLVRRVGVRSAINLFDAKPAIASARDGRIYVAWTRLLTRTYATTVISSSTDDGRTWSTPRVVSRRLAHPQLVSLAADRRGTLYLAGVDARFGIWVARSTDGARHFSVRLAAPLQGNRAATCAFVQEKYPIPFEANHCNGPNPTITATGRFIYVIYAATESNGTQGVRVAVLDRALHLLWRGHVGPPKRSKSDQFFPASAVDPTNGKLWTCYYDTSGDPSRRQAWFSCTDSPDGRHWATPVRAGDASANQRVLIEDARIYGFQDFIGYGGYPGLVVDGGTAHPMWIDTRDLGGRLHEVFAARIEESALSR